MDITRNEKGEINFFVCCILQSIFTLFDYKGFSYTLTQTSTSKDTFCAESSSAVLYLQPTHPNQTLSSCKNKRLTVPPIASVSISAFYEWIPSRIPKKDFIYILKLKQALSLWDPTEWCCSTLSLFPVQRGWRVEKPALPCWLWGVITSQWETMASCLSSFHVLHSVFLPMASTWPVV